MLLVVIALGQGVVLFLEAAHLCALAGELGLQAGDLLALLGDLAILLGEASLVVAIEVQQTGPGLIQLFLNLGKALAQADLRLQLAVLDPAFTTTAVHHLGETGVVVHRLDLQRLTSLDAAEDPVLGARTVVDIGKDVV